MLFEENDIKRFNSNFHVEPPLRSKKDKTQLQAGVKRQTIDVITSNHEPHDADAKFAPFSLTEPGITSFDTFLCSVFELADNGKIDLASAIAAASAKPCEILGIEGGDLSKGARADLCIYDPQKPWQVTPDTLFSAGKNTPLMGHEFSGKVVLTMVNGRVVFDELNK